ncbi:S-adenosyl-L-methionine-dependent methyltransferase [Fomitopsis serialis]|uniref:S-adenosyl-L-methionine-dependent methyltransferase n=1 Tax=Fomitopsis serialis TaxID=139415 RepID=UPI002007D9CF|nr:S-adenosyl-L-methionine-dependent methyltransferase [Neoantrodia serialis]KAH9922936.1 S-adenosyl-L-methionine-dependent methyltransferase [Neoantrodia serialis]
MSGKAEVLSLLFLINKATQDALAAYDNGGHDVPLLSSTDEQLVLALSENMQLKKAVRLLEGACDQLCATLAPPALTMVDRSQGHYAQCLRTILRAGVADVLYDHPVGMHARDLAPLVKIEQGKLSRILRCLATRHCFREVAIDKYAHNRLSLMLRKSNPIMHLADVYLTDIATGGNVLYETITDPRCMNSDDLAKAPVMYAVNGPENEGAMFFDWLRANPDREENFNFGMSGIGILFGSLASLEDFPWKSISTVCDIGSGVGAYAIPLVRQYPNITYTLCDMPATVDQGEELWSSECPDIVQSGRVLFSVLNFLEQAPPPGQDVYYMRAILHSWSDDQAICILKKIRQSMGPTSQFFVHDYVMQHLVRDEDESQQLSVAAPEPMLRNFGAGRMRACNQDMTMLIACNAKERTLQEMSALGYQAGLRVVKVWDLAEACVVQYEIASAS